MRQIGAQSNAIVSQYLVSINPQDGYYTSISSALADATAAAVPAVILVKSGTYTENITLSDNVMIQAIGQNENDPIVTIQGTITISGNIATQLSYMYVIAPSGSPAIYFTGSGASQVTFLDCNIFSTSSSVAALKVDASNTNSVLLFQDSSIASTNYAAIDFVSDCQLVLSGSTYIESGDVMTIQSDTPLTATLTINGFNSMLYPQQSTGNNILSNGVFFDSGYDLNTTTEGYAIVLQDMIINVNNCQFYAPFVSNGTQGKITNSTFYTLDRTCVDYNLGTSSVNSGLTFYQCLFNTPFGYVFDGTSGGGLIVDQVRTTNPTFPNIAPQLLTSTLINNLTSVSYNEGLLKGIRVQRENNTNIFKLPAIAATGKISNENSANSFGSFSSICDVNIGATSNSSFGYWSSNAVYDGNQWQCEGDTTNNGGGYLKVDTQGNLELGNILTSSGGNITVANPSTSFRLTQFQSEFQPTYGTFTGSYEIHTQATYQTNDSTPFAIYNVPLNPSETITFSGTVVGAKSDQSSAIGGNFCATAQRGATGNIVLVGTPIVNINNSDTSQFYVNVNTTTQAIQLVVVGIASTFYNWSAFITYHKMLSNT
jgi:hypothetical protein